MITCIACDRQFETKHAAARHWEQHDLNARLVRLEWEHAALWAALAWLVQAADRLSTEAQYSIPSFVCGVELAAARAAILAATAPDATEVAPSVFPPGARIWDTSGKRWYYYDGAAWSAEDTAPAAPGESS